MQDSAENDLTLRDSWPQNEAHNTETAKHNTYVETPDRLFGECEKEQLISDANGQDSKESACKTTESNSESTSVTPKSRTPLFNLRLVNSRTPKSHKDDKLKGSDLENGSETERHVSFEGDGKYAPLDDEPRQFEFVSDKAKIFGRGSSSTDFFGHCLEEDETDSEDNIPSANLTHVSGSIQNYAGNAAVTLSLEDHKTPYSILKSDNSNRSFLKDKLTSSIRGKKINDAPVKGSEKSPLLGKHSSPTSPISSSNASLPRHSFKEENSHHGQLSSPTRSFNSSEDDSQFHNLSEDTDQHPSPSIVSDDADGACNKYSQLSEHGSSTSSPMTSGDADDRKRKNEDNLLKENGTEDSKKSAKQEVAGLLDNPLQLGVAFSSFVDLEAFKVSLGKRPPRTEDNFGGRSEEHLLVLLRNSGRNLKSYLRNSQWPAESNARQRLWLNICSNLFEKFQENIYKEISDELFDQVSEDEIALPEFVDSDHLHSYFLNTSGILAVKMIMNVISRMSPDIIYCPMLYPLSSLFLHYMSPDACYNCMQALLGTNKPSMFYLTQSKTRTEASKYVLLDLAKKYTKNAYVLIERSTKNHVAVFENWMWWIFKDLPFQYLVSIIDSYLLEGYKVFYRMTLAIIYLFTKDSNRRGSRNSPVQNISAAISRFCSNMPVDAKKFIKVGFGIRGLTRKEITKLHSKHEANLKNHPINDSSIAKVVSSPSMGQFLIARPFRGQVSAEQSSANVLTPEMLKIVWTWVPMRLTLTTLKLLFSSDEDGTALRTLYQKTEHHSPTLLVIKTTGNDVFGAYCSAPWYTRYEVNKPHMSFFGTGESFVFTFQPSPIKYPWTGTLGENAPAHPVDHFMAGDDTMLIVGSGNGEAIYLDTMMNRCSTTHCDTFDNDPLCSENDFSCLIVQVFGFVE